MARQASKVHLLWFVQHALVWLHLYIGRQACLMDVAEVVSGYIRSPATLQVAMGG